MQFHSIKFRAFFCAIDKPTIAAKMACHVWPSLHRENILPNRRLGIARNARKWRRPTVARVHLGNMRNVGAVTHRNQGIEKPPYQYRILLIFASSSLIYAPQQGALVKQAGGCARGVTRINAEISPPIMRNGQSS